MGMGIWALFRPEVPKASTAMAKADGGRLLEAMSTLDRIARERKLAHLSVFADNRDVPGGFDGDPDDLADVLGPWEEWFGPDDGLQVVDGLIDAIGQSATGADELRHPAGVLEELTHLRAALALASKAGARFRLELLD